MNVGLIVVYLSGGLGRVIAFDMRFVFIFLVLLLLDLFEFVGRLDLCCLLTAALFYWCLRVGFVLLLFTWLLLAL